MLPDRVAFLFLERLELIPISYGNKKAKSAATAFLL
jgi:hypothetical protein